MTRRSLGWLAALLVALVGLYHPLLFGRALAGRDAFRLFIPDTAFLLDAWRALDWPLWNPWQRLGQPFAATLQSQAFYPVRWVAMLSGSAVHSVSIEQVLHAGLAAVGTFHFARALGRTSWASALAGAAFGLGPLFTQVAIQQNVVSTAAWAGWVGAAAWAVLVRPGGRATAALGATLGLAFLGGSPETFLWEVGLVAVLVGGRPPARRGALVAIALGLMLSVVTLLPTLEFVLASERSGSGELQPLAWSTPPVALLATAWLNADLPRPTYWGGEQNFLPTVFVGSVVMGLAALAVRRRRARALAAFGLGWGLLSLGAHLPVARWVLALPPFAMFRYPAKYLVAFAFVAAVLSAFGLDTVVAHARRGRPTRSTGLRLAALSLVGALMAALLISTGVVREGGRAGLGLSLTFVALAIGGWALASAPERPAKVRLAVLGAAGLELAAVSALMGQPLWHDGERLSASSPLAAAMEPGFDGRISTRLAAPERDSSVFIEQSRQALVPLRQMEEHLRAVEGYGAPEPRRVDAVFAEGGRAVFDLAGVGYYVRDDGPPFDDLEAVPTPLETPKLYRARTGLPRAFVVHEARVVSEDAARAALTQAQHEFRERVLVTEPLPLRDAPACAERAASVVRSEARRVVIDATSCRDGVLVLTDAWYPGWTATIDGAPVPILRANHLVRAVALPAGAHRIEFTYLPMSFLTGLVLSLVGAALLLRLATRRR